ncbi:Rho guanine nucleotide exchange factor [Salix suchowensis]|nr:Rho guanine nucleotide exchange factor [Salix suchowensis]
MTSITVDQLHAYHAIDRESFLDDKRILIHSKMTSLADTVLNVVADEAALCLDSLEYTNLPIIPIGGGLPFTSINKFTAISGIKNSLNTVCARIFTDILQRVLAGTSQMIGNQPLVVPGFPHPVFGDVTILARPVDNDFPAAELWGWDPARAVPENDRTMFLTFSRGFPVTKEEVAELFTSICGDCVVNVQMQEKSQSSEQPLYAKIIMRTITAVDQILCGRRVAKFRINGKHIWARKYDRRE